MVTTRRMAWKRKSCSYDDVEAHARPGDRAYEAGLGKVDTVAGAQRNVPRERFRPAAGWIALAILMLWRPLELAPIPGWLFKLVALAAFAFVAHGLLTFKRWNDEMRELPRFLLCFAAAVVELGVENWFVWVAAASNARKYDDTFVPLQDNVAIVAKHAMARSGWLHFLLRWHWAHIGNFVVCFLVLPFSVLWDQVPYSGFGMAGRALAMHAAVRVVRTVAFLSVVMPNARTPRCYAQRFPPVPDGMWDYFVAGANAVRGSGGCNDLILSGHGCSWMMPVMTYWTFYPHSAAKWVFAAAFVQSSIRTSIEGWHYSVDFVLPAALCYYMYRDLAWVYPASKVLPERPAGSAPDPVNRLAVGTAVAAIGFAMLNAFLVGA